MERNSLPYILDIWVLRFPHPTESIPESHLRTFPCELRRLACCSYSEFPVLEQIGNFVHA